METFDWRPGEYFLPSREKNLAQGRKLKKKEREKKRKKRKRKKEKKFLYGKGNSGQWWQKGGETIKLLVRIYSPVGDARTSTSISVNDELSLSDNDIHNNDNNNMND